MEVSIYQKVKDFINTLKVGDTFTRQELIKATNTEEGIKQFHDYNSTMDNYRNYFTQAGYLKTLKRGQYKILKMPDSKLTQVTLMTEAYPDRELKATNIKKKKS